MQEDNDEKIRKEEEERKKKDEMDEHLEKLTKLAEQAASKRTMADFPIHDHSRGMGGMRRDDSSISSVARSRRASRKQANFRRQDSSVSSSSRGTSVVSEMDAGLIPSSSQVNAPPQFRSGAPNANEGAGKVKANEMVNQDDMIEENEADLASISDGSEEFHSMANEQIFRELADLKN